MLLGLLAAFSLIVIPRLADRLMASETNTLAEKVLAAVVILLLLSLLADWIGAEDILGTFLAGICLNAALHRHDRVRQHVEFVGRQLFIPFFFVDTGMRLELDIFVDGAHVWLLAAALVGVVMAGKSAAAWTTGWFFGYAIHDRIVMAGLSFPQAAATLAVIVVGMELDIVDQVTADAVSVVIFITCLVGPLVTGRARNAFCVRSDKKTEEAATSHGTPLNNPPPGPFPHGVSKGRFMWTWIQTNADVVSALAAVAMLAVWTLYLQLIYGSLRRSRRTKILINRGRWPFRRCEMHHQQHGRRADLPGSSQANA